MYHLRKLSKFGLKMVIDHPIYRHINTILKNQNQNKLIHIVQQCINLIKTVTRIVVIT